MYIYGIHRVLISIQLLPLLIYYYLYTPSLTHSLFTHMSHIGKKSDLFTRLLQYDINEERLVRLKAERGEPVVGDPSAAVLLPSTDITTTATFTDDFTPTADQSAEATSTVEGSAPAKKTRVKKLKAPKAPKPVILGPLEQHDHILKHGYGYTDEEIAQMHIEDTARITEILENAGKVKSQREISIKTLAISPVEDFTPAGQCVCFYGYMLCSVYMICVCISLFMHIFYLCMYMYLYAGMPQVSSSVLRKLAGKNLFEDGMSSLHFYLCDKLPLYFPPTVY